MQAQSRHSGNDRQAGLGGDRTPFAAVFGM
jgi:hypothetical protein